MNFLHGIDMRREALRFSTDVAGIALNNHQRHHGDLQHMLRCVSSLFEVDVPGPVEGMNTTNQE